MPEYLLSATDPTGRRITERVTAPSAADALAQARARGLSEIVLHTDDLSAIPSHESTPARVQKSVRASDVLRFQHAGPVRTFLLQAWIAYRNIGFVMLVLAGIFLLRRFRGSPLIWIDWVNLAFLILPLLLVLLGGGGTHVYRRIQTAAVAARWDDLLAQLPQLERVLRKISAAAPACELAGYRARALAGLGRQNEAFAVLDELDRHADVPPWRRATLRYSVFVQLEDLAAAERCLLNALAVEPGDPGLWMTLAELYAFHLDRAAEARAALERLRCCPLSDETHALLPALESAIHVAEGRFAQARSELERDIVAFRRRIAATPLAEALLRRTEALLVITCAKLGDTAAARGHFTACEPFLVAHKAQSLLSRCRAALAAAAPSPAVRAPTA
ncbi:MAG: hypothetical protein AB1716_01315 [Planctomycetota bacterium]